jgi:copper homeostasis protein CutC
MTQPHIIGPGAKARSATDKLISSLLTVLLEELGNGASRDQIGDLVGVELNEPRVDLARMRLLAACAVSRLAVLHHAVEQLADQQDAIAAKYTTDHQSDMGNGMAAAFRLVSAELRKLVDDHG